MVGESGWRIAGIKRGREGYFSFVFERNVYLMTMRKKNQQIDFQPSAYSIIAWVVEAIVWM